MKGKRTEKVDKTTDKTLPPEYLTVEYLYNSGSEILVRGGERAPSEEEQVIDKLPNEEGER